MADDDRLERLLLMDDETLRALAAWVSLPKYEQEREDLEQWGEADIWYHPMEWAVSAGLQIVELGMIRVRLASMQIVDPEGLPWEPAMMLARNLAAARIKRRAKAS